MFKTQCGELGNIVLVQQKPRHEPPHNQTFRCDTLDTEALEQIRNMARTVSGIEGVVLSKRHMGFVLIMSPAVSAKGAQQTGIDFVHRVVRYFNRRDANERHLRSGEGLAIHSHVRPYSGSAG